MKQLRALDMVLFFVMLLFLAGLVFGESRDVMPALVVTSTYAIVRAIRLAVQVLIHSNQERNG